MLNVSTYARVKFNNEYACNLHQRNEMLLTSIFACGTSITVQLKLHEYITNII